MMICAAAVTARITSARPTARRPSCDRLIESCTRPWLWPCAWVCAWPHRASTAEDTGRLVALRRVGIASQGCSYPQQTAEAARPRRRADTRVFKVALPGARMKLAGGDSGRVEHERFVEDVILAPSERVVVDVLFEQPGDLALEHRTPERVHQLAAITVDAQPAEPSLREQFQELRSDPELMAERRRASAAMEAEPDKTLAFIAEMEFEALEGPVIYQCPMHEDVVS